jgi:hypothetical protein
MSLTAFKKKSVIQYGSKRSGKPPGGYWLPQGPFGHSTTSLQLAIDNYGTEGFSLNGPHRNVGYIGKSSAMSKNGTPFRGTQPLGCGGHFGTYARPEPVFNSNRVIVEGTQYLYVKPTVLTTYGMLDKKYRWIRNGVYPNFWVQPNYTGLQSETKSQGMYLHDLTTANTCVSDINNPGKYEGFIKDGGSTLCYNTTSRFKYDDMARNGLYTKQLQQPETSSQHTLRIQRKCANPIGAQKPFPFATSTGTGIKRGGINATSVGNSCNTTQNIYLAPPEWYIKSSSGIN